MSDPASPGTVLAFQPRRPVPAPEPAAAPVPTARGADDAKVYAFAAAILREGYRLAVIHVNETVPRLNSTGPRRPS